MRLAPLNRFSPPVKYLTDRSKAVLLLWIFYVFVLSCVCYVFVRVCLYMLCGHLLGKGWPLGSRLWCLTVSLSLSHWYPGSGVVLDCIDSWSLHPYLLCLVSTPNRQISQMEVITFMFYFIRILNSSCFCPFYRLLTPCSVTIMPYARENTALFIIYHYCDLHTSRHSLF